MKYLLFIFLPALLTVGCKTTGHRVQWYDGAPMNKDQVALLKLQRDFGGVNLRVDTIDGKRLNKGKWYILNNTEEVELLPGNHDFTVGYSDGNGGESISDLPVGFNAETNKIYRMQAARGERTFGQELSMDLFGGRFPIMLWVTDEETGKVVAGKRREAPIHWYEK